MRNIFEGWIGQFGRKRFVLTLDANTDLYNVEGFEGVGECVMRRNVDKEESVEMRARQVCFVQLLVDYNLYVVNT